MLNQSQRDPWPAIAKAQRPANTPRPVETMIAAFTYYSALARTPKQFSSWQ